MYYAKTYLEAGNSMFLYCTMIISRVQLIFAGYQKKNRRYTTASLAAAALELHSKMPILKDFSLPASSDALQVPGNNGNLFVAFITSDDPDTKQSWCPDVRAALPAIKAAFTADDSPAVAFVEVGQKPE